MGNKNNMHTSPVSKSKYSLMAVEILKRASGPLSLDDVQRMANELFPRPDGKNTIPAGMVSNALYLIRMDDGNEGYGLSDAVRFPGDKKTPRYWLTAAPRWTPSWTVTRDLRVVPISRAAIENLYQEGQHQRNEQPVLSRRHEGTKESEQKDPQKKKCAYSKCDVMLDRGTTCSSEHFNLWKQELKDIAFGKTFMTVKG